MKKKYLYISLGLLVWGLLAYFSYEVSFVTKAFTRFFAGGISYSKDFFFLFWVAAFYLVFYFDPKPKKIYPKPFVAVALILPLAMNFLSHVVYCRKFKLSLTGWTLAASGHEYSTNTFLHVHTMKGMFIPLLKYFGLNSIIRKADPGLPFYSIVPHWIFLLGFIFSLVGLWVLIQACLAGRQVWDKKIRETLTAIYIIAAYSLYKSFFDGGMLAPEVISVLPLLVLIVGTKNKNLWSLGGKYILSTGTVLILVLGWYVAVKWGEGAGFKPLITSSSAAYIFQIFILCNVFFFIFGFFVYTLDQKKSLLTASALLLGAYAYFAPGNWPTAWNFLRMEVVPRDKVFIGNFWDQDFPYPVQYQEGLYKVHAFHPDKPTRIWDYYKQLGIPPYYNAIEIDSPTCNEAQGSIQSGRILSLEQAPEIVDKPSELLNSFEIHRCGENEGCDYWYRTEIKGCVPLESTNEPVNNHLGEIGFRKFIMIYR